MHNLSYGNLPDLQENKRARKTDFHMKSTPELVLKKMLKATRKWTIKRLLAVYQPHHFESDTEIED